MSSIRAGAASGVFWTAMQVWIVRATTAGAFIILSRQLQPSEFGLISLAMAIITVLSLLSDSGLATFVIRAAEVSPRMLTTAFWTTMMIAGVLTALLAFLAGPLADLFNEPGLVSVLRWLSLGMLLTGLNGVPSALLKRDMRFKQLAARGMIATITGSTVAIVLALNGAGVWALVAQSLVRGVISVIIIWTAVRWWPGLVWDRKQAGEMLQFGSKLLSIDLLIQARDRGEDFTLAAISSATTLGYWSVANRLIRIIQETGSSVISSVATPVFAKMQNDLPRLHRAYATSMSSAGIFMFPSMLFLAVTSRDLIPFLLGEQWATTAAVAQVAALTAVVGVFSYFDRTVFVAINRLRPEIILVACIVTFHLAIVIVVAPHGLLPLAIALGARACITFVARQIVLHRVAGVPYSALLDAARVLVAALGMALVVLLVGGAADGMVVWQRLILLAAVAAAVYPLLLALVARPTVRQLVGDVKSLRGGKAAPVLPVTETADPDIIQTSATSSR